MKLVTQLTGSGLSPLYPYTHVYPLGLATLLVAIHDDGREDCQLTHVGSIEGQTAPVRGHIFAALDALTAFCRALQLSDEDRVRALLPKGWELRVEHVNASLTDVWVLDGKRVLRIDVWHKDRPAALRTMAAALRELRDGGGT